MKACVINYAAGLWYPKGQRRLIESLNDVGFNGDVLDFNNKNFIKCPKHSDIPYAFKPFAIQEARNMGYKLILWIDASFWAIKNPSSIFEFMKKYGQAIQKGSNCLGHWCSDITLDRFNITREEAFNIPLFPAGFVGLNMENKKSQLFLDEWLFYAKDGTCFKGAHRNKNNCVSKDNRVQGHRHDMSVASILVRKLDIQKQPRETFFHIGGRYKKTKSYNSLKSSICFCARGM